MHSPEGLPCHAVRTSCQCSQPITCARHTTGVLLMIQAVSAEALLPEALSGLKLPRRSAAASTGLQQSVCAPNYFLACALRLRADISSRFRLARRCVPSCSSMKDGRITSHQAKVLLPLRTLTQTQRGMQ